MKDKLNIVFSELFQVSLVTYLILLILETLKQGFVSNIFNLNILLGIVLLGGVMKVLTEDEDKYSILTVKGFYHFWENWTPQEITENDFYFAVLISVGGALLVYFKTQELSGISIFIAVITMVIIALLSYLILTDSEEES